MNSNKNTEKDELYTDVAATSGEKETVNDSSIHVVQTDAVRAMNESIFDVDSVDNEIVRRLRPRYLAHGGNQIVYDIPSMPHLVAKADAEIARRVICKNIELGQSLDALPNRNELMKGLRAEKGRFRRLTKIFGKEHVLPQARILRKVPVTEKIVSELFYGRPPGRTSEVWTAVTLQTRAGELHDKNRLDLTAGYAEFQPPAETDTLYFEITAALLESENHTKVKVEDFLKVQNSNSITKIVKAAESDGELKKVLRELIQKAIAYSIESGELLDLAGSDNLILFKKEGVWSYKLVDALYPGEFDTIAEARTAILKIQNGEKLEGNEQSCILNALNYVRTMNGLANYLGINARIDLLPSEKNLSVDFRSALKEIVDAHK